MIDYELNTLLDLHGQLIAYDEGYWVKIEAWEVAKSYKTPQGIRYSLSLHDSKGNRILGYDNAHQLKEKGRKFTSNRNRPYDHRHIKGKDFTVVYRFEGPQKLLTDFFNEVNTVLEQENDQKNP
jgi:hypothetical protein